MNLRTNGLGRVNSREWTEDHTVPDGLRVDRLGHDRLIPFRAEELHDFLSLGGGAQGGNL